VIEPPGAASPRFTARMTGLFYLLMMLAGGMAAFARRGVIVAGDAAATASNLMAHPARWQLTIVGELLVVAFYFVVVALLYVLLKPAGRTIPLIAAFVGLAACTIQGAASIFLVAPVAALSGATYLTRFSPEQLQTLAMFSLKLFSATYGIALAFFGFYDLLIGWLVYRSTFMPRVIGVLVMVAGPGGLSFLSPALGAIVQPYLLVFFLGEGVLILWLLVKGVNVDRWRERQAANDLL